MSTTPTTDAASDTQEHYWFQNEPVRSVCTMSNSPTKQTAEARPKTKRECRWWDKHEFHGWLVLMSETDGWAMVRRPGCMPFVMESKEWTSLPWEPS